MGVPAMAALFLSFFGKATTVHPKGSDQSLYGFRKVRLGGTDQTILIRTANIHNPVFLFLHGGPGSPEMPQAVKLSRKIESFCTLVIWDQRGCGKSYLTKSETISQEQIAEDAIELIHYIKKCFNKTRVGLIGHSWGTIISMHVISRIPEDIQLYVSIGQVVDFKRNEEISYKHLLERVKKSNDRKALHTLLEIGPPIEGLYRDNIPSLMKQRRLLLKFGLVYYGRRNANRIVRIIFSAPEYTLREKLRYAKNQIHAMERIWNADLMRTNFISQMPEISVPVFFIVGDCDYNTPKELVFEYCDKISAPMKKVILFEKSGHDPHVEETERFAEVLLECVNEVR